jgi:quercetin dioxygenase-like cupin family protein
MERDMSGKTAWILTTCAMALAAMVMTSARAADVPRKEVARHDLSTPGREGVMIVATLQPGETSQRHTHPGEDFGYVLEGTIVLHVSGRPDQTLTKDQVFFIERGIAHNATNTGPIAARVLDTYVVDKGKPVLTPVP